MRKFLSSLFSGTNSSVEAPVVVLSADSDGDGSKLKGATQLLDPGAPYAYGEAVPRWPEEGAALVAAVPADLVSTQVVMIQNIRQSSPLSPADFDRMILPVLERYASWVHLLPASEAHHHFGPGGLLAHGIEVAWHAARMADGLHVGLSLPPKERTYFQPRWRVATMLAGLFHDIGKPLVDAGATSPDNKIRWRAMEGSLYDWLVRNKLTHYRVYWRPGERHERHKAVGTAVMREIIGPELIAWLADEPSDEVMQELLASVANGKIQGNLMSKVVSKADSMSVESDLKRLAKRTQGMAAGGQNNLAALVMRELHAFVEQNKFGEINRPGKLLWVLDEGVAAVYPAVIEQILPSLSKKNLPGMPASRAEVAELLTEAGYLVPAYGESIRGDEQRSLTWLMDVDDPAICRASPIRDLMVVRFAEPSFLFGNLPLPKAASGSMRPPFKTPVQLKAIADGVRVVDEPQAADGDASLPPSGVPGQGAPSVTSSPAGETAEAVSVAGSQSEPVIEAARNRGDRKQSNEDKTRIEAFKDRVAETFVKASERLERGGFAGTPLLVLLGRIAGARVKYRVDAWEAEDGLRIRYPESFADLGMPAVDILEACLDKGWCLPDEDSGRGVTTRDLPGSGSTRVVVLTGLPLRVWQALVRENPQVLEGQAVVLGDDLVDADEQVVVKPDASPPQGRPQPVVASQPPARAQQPLPRQPQRQVQPPPRNSPAQSDKRAGQAVAAESSGAGHSAGGQRAAGGAAPVQPKPRQVPPQTGAPQNRPITAAQPRQPGSDKPPVRQPQAPVAPPAGDKTWPSQMEDIAVARTGDLTPLKVMWINGILMRMIGLDAKSNGMDPMQADVSHDLIQRCVAMLLRSGDVRQAPLIQALSTTDNPAVIFKSPSSMSVEDITDFARNPDYIPPRWVFSPPNKGDLFPGWSPGRVLEEV